MSASNTLIVLRQVDGTRWCVVQHAVKDGKRAFAGRIATAREYEEAARIAIATSAKMRRHLAIEGNGKLLRRFDWKRDAPAGHSGPGGSFSHPYGREDF
ncbi:MAG: hypothetical protein PGN08_13385 [Sphingomonas taxi]